MTLASDLLETCREVITMRQNPSRLAAVFRMCWEVLFAMFREAEDQAFGDNRPHPTSTSLCATPLKRAVPPIGVRCNASASGA